MSSPDDSSASTLQPRPEDGLLVIDVQNDFLPGGALAVPHGEPLTLCVVRPRPTDKGIR